MVSGFSCDELAVRGVASLAEKAPKRTFADVQTQARGRGYGWTDKDRCVGEGELGGAVVGAEQSCTGAEVQVAREAALQGDEAAQEPQCVTEERIGEENFHSASAWQGAGDGEGADRGGAQCASTRSAPDTPLETGDAGRPAAGTGTVQPQGADNLIHGAARPHDTELLSYQATVQQQTEAPGQEPAGADALVDKAKQREAPPADGSPGSGRGFVTLQEVEMDVSDKQRNSLGGGGEGDMLSSAQQVGAHIATQGDHRTVQPDLDATMQVRAEVEPLLETSHLVSPSASANLYTSSGNGQASEVVDHSSVVGTQILDSLHASLTHGDGHVVIRLYPPELGRVVVRFHGGEDQIDATLEVSRAETRYAVQESLPQVLRSLQGSGVQIGRFEVVVSDDAEGGLAREHTEHEAWTRHQGGNTYAAETQAAADLNWLASDGDHQGYAESGLPTVGEATDRINLLL